MNNMKMVQTINGKKYFSTISRQRELEEQSQQLKIELEETLFSIPEGDLTISDYLMNIAFYIGLPVMVICSLVFALSV